MPKFSEIMINKDSKYNSLKDDIEEIKRKGIESLYHTYWEIGQRIRKELPVNGSFTEEPELKSLLDTLTKDTGINKRTLYQSVQFFDKYPTKTVLEKIPLEQPSWTKIRTELLPETKKKPVKELKAVKEIIAESKPEVKATLTDKCNDCKIVRKMADKISELEEVIKALKTPPKKPAIMGFNFQRIQKRYLDLYEKKKGQKSGFIKWAAFNSALSKIANIIPEQEVFDCFENFFDDKWAKENDITNPLVYLNNIDKYRIRNKTESRKPKTLEELQRKYS